MKTTWVPLIIVALAGCTGASGSDGAPIAMRSSRFAADERCPTGGSLIEYGADDGSGEAKALDRRLDDGEVDGSTYVCDGAVGAPGAQGETGDTGAKGDAGEVGIGALITTRDPTTAECSDGGVVVQYGADANRNGELDAAERAEKIVCAISNSITTDREITVAASGADFTSLRAALASLEGRRIASTATITIRIASGTYVEESPLEITHPDGRRIFVIGDVNFEDNVVLEFRDSNGIILSGHALGRLEGLSILGEGAAPNRTGLVVRDGAYIELRKVTVRSFTGTGVDVSYGGNLFADELESFDHTSTCLSASRGGKLVALNAQVRECEYGFRATELAAMIVQTASASDCRYGFSAELGGYIYAPGAAADVATPGTGSAFASTHGGVLYVPDSEATGGVWSYSTLAGGLIDATDADPSGATGAFSPEPAHTYGTIHKTE